MGSYVKSFEIQSLKEPTARSFGKCAKIGKPSKIHTLFHTY